MSLLNFGQGLIIGIGVTLIMFLSTQGVIDGSLTLGDLVLINTMMLQLFMPLGFLGIIYRALKYAMADMDLVFKLLDHDVEIKDAKNAQDLKIDKAHIQFKDVEFSYQAERTILNKISFEVQEGQKVAVVGASGAGKSTLSRLLFRFYDLQGGSIFIDGQNISNVKQQSLREAIGIVPQDTVLFNESIFYNIQYANPKATDDEVHQAAKMADIHDFINNLPEGYQTVVGERGLKLSGGEKQRVAIARVLLKQPKILIFDEATSSLDSRSEQAILTSLTNLSEKRSTLVIAHRLSTIIDADQILVMEKGEIVEQGTHKGLLAKKGLYKTLWDLQQDTE
jgi:ATP-binding cassette subfamily B protein